MAKSELQEIYAKVKEAPGLTYKSFCAELDEWQNRWIERERLYISFKQRTLVLKSIKTQSHLDEGKYVLILI